MKHRDRALRGIAFGPIAIALLGMMTIAHAQIALTLTRPSATSVRLSWPDAGPSVRLEATSQLGTDAIWLPVETEPVLDTGRYSVTVQAIGTARFFRLRTAAAVAASIRETSPVSGESGVAVSRETIFHFSSPLAKGTIIGPDTVFAGFGGRRLLSRAQLSSDRRALTLFYLENLPASAQIAVVLDGTGLRDESGLELDADGDGRAGGTFTMRFTTLGNTALPGTAVIGRVFASKPGPGGENRPIAGATITVDGAEETLRAVTDTNGFFRLQPAPAGRFFVHIDGRTAVGSQWPTNAYYPVVGKAWDAVAGRTNNMAGGTGEIFLPLIPGDALQPVSTASDTLIHFSPSVVAANPALAQVSITVPANALFSDNGARGGRVGIAPVPPDRLPGPLPPGLEMPLVITVQTDGGLNFDRPAPICFPNVLDPVLGTTLPAGSQQSLISFNHDKGEWEAVGTMTVSADGKLICSDPGSGIRQPGWHGVGPAPVGPPPPNHPPRCGDDPAASIAVNGVGPKTPVKPCNCRQDPLILKKCFEIADDAYATCKELAYATLQQAMKVVAALFDSGAISYEEYTKRVTGISSAYERRLQACAREYLDDSADCADCWGTPAPPASPRFGPANRASPGASSLHSPATQPDPTLTIFTKLEEMLLLASQVGQIPASTLTVQIDRLIDEIDTLADGNFELWAQARVIERQRIAAADPPTPSFGRSLAPPYPVHYVADILRPSGVLQIRGVTRAWANATDSGIADLRMGDYSVFVPRDGRLLSVSFFDPISRAEGLSFPDFRPESPYGLPHFALSSPSANAKDSDSDGLTDVAEDVLGTDPLAADSDGDGLRDGVEVDQGNNPLDGIPMQQGIVASVQTLGVAVDVCAFDNFAVVAEGAAGVSVFNASNVFNPVRVAQVDTPGDARAVACEGNLVAVADGGAGLAVVDITDRAASFIARQVALPGNAVAVSVSGGLAFAGLDNGIVAVVEMATGRLLSTMALGLNGLQDVLSVGEAIHVLVPPKLFTLSFEGSALAIASEVAASPVPTFHSRRLRLNAGQSLLYAATVNGFQVFSLSDPLKPALLRANATPQAGWRQLVPNGSGLGVGVAGVNSSSPDAASNNVYLHDLEPGETNSVFLALLPTPGLAGALALFNGLAYVADGSAGLQVLNYIAADTAGVPPTITLGASFPLIPFAQAESGSRARLLAAVGDDVQVRTVEFYANDTLLATDGNYPFEAGFTTPLLLSGTPTNFTIRAKATDTGGNSTWSAETTVALVPDATQPRVRRISPVGGGKIVDRITVYFSEPIRPATFTPSTVRILSAGADGIFDTADDAPVPAVNYPVNPATFAAEAGFAAPLAEGRYRVTLGTGITDLNNNPLAVPVTQEFRVADATFWTGSASTAWENPLNWSRGVVPGPADRVILPSGKVVINQRAVLVRSLESAADMELAVGSLEATEGMILRRNVLLNRGVLRRSSLTLTDGAVIRVNNQQWSELDDMTIAGDVDLGTGISGGQLLLRNRIALAGRLRNASAFAALRAEGNVTFLGGTIVLNSSLTLPTGTIFILAADATLRGPGGISGPGEFINEGALLLDGPAGSTLNIAPAHLSHRGTAEVTGGGQLLFGGKWGGEGLVNVVNGRFAMGGELSLPLPRVTKAAAGGVDLTGQLNLQGGTLTLDAVTGSWRLNGGGLLNGTLNLTEGARLLGSANENGLLEAMAVNGLVETERFGLFNVRDGLTLNGTLRTGFGGTLHFAGEQTVTGGLLDIVSGGLKLPVGARLTLSETTTLSGSGAGLDGVGTLVNHGVILSERESFAITPGALENHGSIEVRANASLRLGGALTGSGPIDVTRGRLILSGSFPGGQPLVRTAAAGRVEINALIDLNGRTLALNATTGGWLLNGGGFRNGTLTLADGVRLGAYFGENTLDHVTLNGALDLAGENSFGSLTIRNGLTLGGSLNVTGDARVTFDGTQTFAGSALVLSDGGRAIVTAASTLTLATDAVVRGGTGTLEGAGSVLNSGRISADVAGRTLRITVATFTNQGILEAINGGTLVAPGFP